MPAYPGALHDDLTDTYAVPPLCHSIQELSSRARRRDSESLLATTSSTEQLGGAELGAQPVTGQEEKLEPAEQKHAENKKQCRRQGSILIANLDRILPEAARRKAFKGAGMRSPGIHGRSTLNVIADCVDHIKGLHLEAAAALVHRQSWQELKDSPRPTGIWPRLVTLAVTPAVRTSHAPRTAWCPVRAAWVPRQNSPLFATRHGVQFSHHNHLTSSAWQPIEMAERATKSRRIAGGAEVDTHVNRNPDSIDSGLAVLTTSARAQEQPEKHDANFLLAQTRAHEVKVQSLQLAVQIAPTPEHKKDAEAVLFRLLMQPAVTQHTGEGDWEEDEERRGGRRCERGEM